MKDFRSGMLDFNGGGVEDNINWGIFATYPDR
jgi:hypothetical protein